MAKVVWREKASLLLEEHLDYALNEFGRKAVSIIMKHFKLIHYYDSDNDTVFIDYIWDMRMNPVKLKRMIFE